MRNMANAAAQGHPTGRQAGKNNTATPHPQYLSATAPCDFPPSCKSRWLWDANILNWIYVTKAATIVQLKTLTKSTSELLQKGWGMTEQGCSSARGLEGVIAVSNFSNIPIGFDHTTFKSGYMHRLGAGCWLEVKLMHTRTRMPGASAMNNSSSGKGRKGSCGWILWGSAYSRGHTQSDAQEVKTAGV